MHIVQLSLIAILMNSNCIQLEKSEETDFDRFLKKFELKDPPFSIDENSTFNRNYQNQLDSLDLEKYVEKNRIMANRNMYESFRYYPLQLIKYSSFFAILILKRGGAGAFDDRVILNILDVEGNIKQSLIVANKLGDCSRLNLMEMKMERNSLTMNKVLKRLDCDTEQVISQKEELIVCSLSDSGKIEKH